MRNVGIGKYLGIESEPENGIRVVVIDSPFSWHIRPDEEDDLVYRLFAGDTKFNVELSDHGNTTVRHLIDMRRKRVTDCTYLLDAFRRERLFTSGRSGEEEVMRPVLAPGARWASRTRNRHPVSHIIPIA